MAKASKIKSIYIIGSMRNPNIVSFGNALRKLGIDAFDDWWAPGARADDNWRNYELAKGHTFKEAIRGHTARHIYEFDKGHLDRCDAAVMLAPVGRSGHMELGYTIGRNKPGFIVFSEDPKRFDIMYGFATEIFFSQKEFFKYLKAEKGKNEL